MIFPLSPGYAGSPQSTLPWMPRRHKVFISYHHENDQWYKNELEKYGKETHDFIGKSVGDGDISEDKSDEAIRRTIRDEYLKDSTVTLVLIGEETKGRKHIDWEIYSSMYDGLINKKNGIACIVLPGINCAECYPSPTRYAYPGGVPVDWDSVSTEDELRGVDMLGKRLKENLIDGKICVLSWERITWPGVLKWLIEQAFANREDARYKLTRRMMRNRPRQSLPNVWDR